MQQNTTAALNALIFAAGLLIVSTSQAAPASGHESHATQESTTASLQLNDGKKWETDAALRQSMAAIRKNVDASLQDIHKNRLSAARYGALASKVENEVANIVGNCKLEPKADAQLHLIVVALLEGASQMADKAKHAKRRDGAIKIIGALGKYPIYFNDPDFKALEH